MLETLSHCALKPWEPHGKLVEGPSGEWYGLTWAGGDFGVGTVFAWRTNHNLEVLASFEESGLCCNAVSSVLALGSDGALYGTSVTGGAGYTHTTPSGTGVVYRVERGGGIQALRRFEGPDGARPVGALVEGPGGYFYGMTERGGQFNRGTVYRINRSGSFETLVHFDGSNGAEPLDGFILDANGWFYGTTSRGGEHNDGTVFRMTSDGQMTTLVSFNRQSGIYYPTSPPLRLPDGSFLGNGECGGQFTTCYWQWSGGSTVTNIIDIAQFLDPGSGQSAPREIPALGLDGKVYTTTSCGQFEFSPASIIRLSVDDGLHSEVFRFGATNGTSTSGGVALGKDGWLYGVAGANVPALAGLLYRFHPTGAFEELYVFEDTDRSPTTPSAGLLVGPGGRLYGRSLNNASFSLPAEWCHGAWRVAPLSLVLFRLETNERLDSILMLTNATHATRSKVTYYNQTPGLTLLTNGTAFVVAPAGGTNFLGSISLLNAADEATTLASLDGTNGAYPMGELIEGNDGVWYGTAAEGGEFGQGTLFQFDGSSTITRAVSFGGTNGAAPNPRLLRLLDGSFAGSTWTGGTSNVGTLFQYVPGGSLVTLHEFTGDDGANPGVNLVAEDSGALLGTTSTGGAWNAGTVFRLETNGTLSTLLHFDGANGAYAVGGLIRTRQARVFGTTARGGTFGAGTIFEWLPSATIRTLIEFHGANGSSPYAGLLEGSDGSLYGTTATGGRIDYGTVFRLLEGPMITGVEATSAALELTWTSTAGRTYHVESLDLKGSDGWIEAGPPAVADAETMNALLPLPNLDAILFRVVRSPAR